MSIHFQSGSSFGPYQIESEIGRGGMGVVYLAVQLNLERRVALKVLAPQFAQQEEFRRRFLRESRTSGNLEHPNVIPVYDAGEIDGLLFIAMRDVRGRDLGNLIGQRGALESGQALHVLTEVSKGLSAADRVGLVHRDIKPANVLLAFEGPHIDAVYLTDFGLTKYVESSSQITKSGFFLGTYRYASPEQFKGVHVDHRSDIYSLGCMAFECLTGRAPFVRDTDAAMMHVHLIEAVPAASSMVSNLPSAVDAVIERSMSKNADERYDSCGALVTELRSALVSPSGETSRPLVAPAVVETTEPADVSALETDAPPRASSAPTNPAIETGVSCSWTTTAHSPRGRDRQGNEGDPLPPTSPATSRGTKTKAETRRRLLAAALIIAMAGGVFLFTRSQRTPASPSDAGFGGNRHAQGGAEETGFGGNRPAETETEETGAGPGTIAFNSVSDGNLDVFTISPSGENLTRLTDNEGRDGGASWSPDGERIAYTSEQSSGEFEIFVMNKDGSGATNLTSNTTTELHPAWSPDGRRIVFSSDRTGRTEIFTMRPDGTNVRQVTDNGSADFEPSWSADSSRSGSGAKREGNFDVVIVSATGAEETVIAGRGILGEANQEDAMLSPTDNDLIAFASDAGGDYEIVVLHLATGKADVLTSNGVNDRDPAWSPDGIDSCFLTR